MSQTTQPATDDDSNDSGNSLADVLIEELAVAQEVLESVNLSEIEDMSDEDLVDLRVELKALEDTVETARKKKAEKVLEDRVEPGERLHGLHRVESHNKYVDEDPGAVIARAALAGVSWTDFVDLNASALADTDLDVDIGRYEYTYFR